MTEVDHAARRPHRASRFRPAGGGGRVGTGGSRPDIVGSELPQLPPLTDRPNVRVGVVDTGVILIDDQVHPYLTGRIAGPADGGDGDIRYAEPEFGHGTFVSGRILRNAPSSTVQMRRGLLASDVDGEFEDLAVAAAITSLVDEGVKLINLSFVGEDDEDDPPAAIRDAMAGAVIEHDVVFVVAAGNNFDVAHRYPAEFATDPEFGAHVLAVADRSTWSGEPSWIAAFADGYRQLGPLSTADLFGVPSFAWARWSGSSFAAATVTGVLAAAAARLADQGSHQPVVDAAREAGLLGPRDHAPLEVAGVSDPVDPWSGGHG
jgi:subtilisin family serine protease